MENNDKPNDSQQDRPNYNPKAIGFNFDKFDKNKQKFLKALVNCLGIVSDAAIQANMSRAIHYEWLKSDEEYAKSFDEIKDAQLDFAETQLMKGMKSGNPQLISFYLRTKGKQRGYMEEKAMIEMDKVERAVITLPGGLSMDL